MAAVIFSVGVIVAAALLSLLAATLIDRRLRFWPTPGPGAWQNFVFWPLFRGLNVICFVSAIVAAWIDHPAFFQLPLWFRSFAGLLLVASLSVFLFSFFALGRDNSYGAQEGLVTDGIYRWTRNPQNAMLVVVYACLSLTSDSGPVYLLCTAMMAVYWLMVLAEEPWLETAYGDAYRRYCTEVPRFFNWRRALNEARGLIGSPRS